MVEVLKAIPWTLILTVVISLLGAAADRLFTEYVQPYLYAHGLTEAATIAVQAAEAMYGRGGGEAKLKSALDALAAQGYNIDSVEVTRAIMSAWQELNIAQIGVGIKEA